MASRSATSRAAATVGICPITGEAYSSHTSVVLDHLHPSLAERIRQDHPSLAADALISRAAADRYRLLHVEELLRQERGELTALDKEVARSLAEGVMVSTNPEETYDEKRTLGERLSDGLSTFGGSWPFLIFFGLALAIWIALNSARGDRPSIPIRTSCSISSCPALLLYRRRSS